MLTVTKRFEFCYGHYLPKYEGKCETQHGHNAILEVEVEGMGQLPKAPDGMVCDFSVLKKLVEQNIISELDHKNLNDLLLPDDTKYIYGKFVKMVRMPTAENIVGWIVSVLQEDFKLDLKRVRFYETPDSYAEWSRA